MIYNRFGDVVTIKRVAALADIEKLDGRKPSKADRDATKDGSYVVVETCIGERLYHKTYLRADGGSQEIADAIITAGGRR